MNKIIYYSKYIFIFVILELFISFIASLLNLLNVNSGITSIILLLSNIIIFGILSYKNGRTVKKDGIKQGLILGIILIIIMYLLRILLFNNNFNVSILIYYLILLITSTLSSIIVVNKKSDE